MLAPALTILILLGYALSLWWLLRRESVPAMVALVGLCGVAVGLRLYLTTEYPRGLNEDEAKVLWCSVRFLRMGDLFGEGCTGVPLLLTTLFEAQLVPWLGAGRWAIRIYSMTLGVLSVPAAFATARAMLLRTGPSLAAGAFVTVLPWAMLYGRVHQGGELLFHQLLLLAALARLVWCGGKWTEVLIGAFALCLAFYTYFSGRAMLAMPFVAAVLATGHRRLLCLLVPVVAFLGWLPFLLAGPEWALVGLSTLELHPDYQAALWHTLRLKTINTLSAFVSPIAQDGWLTIRSGALHAWWFLGLAALGSLTGVRRALFLWAGFVAGLLPSILAHGTLLASTHRMHAAYAFVSLSAACAVDLIRWRIPRLVVSGAVVAVIAFQSVRLYFSPDFWPATSQWIFDWERTEVVEAIPSPPPRRIVATDLGYYIDMRWDLQPSPELLTVENWVPTEPSIYLFGARAGVLQSFYMGLLGPSQVKSVGRAFLVRIDRNDSSWMRRHGWSYEARCGVTVQRGHVPALFHFHFSFRPMRFCTEPVRHLWKGRWLGPSTLLRLRYSGKARVATSAGFTAAKDGLETLMDFRVEPGTDVEISLETPGVPLVVLYDAGAPIERVPYWEWVEPLPFEPPAPPTPP